MKAGFAERDITPSAGMERPGDYGKQFHSGDVHDPCKVRAAVFDDGTSRAALVGCDVAMMPRYVAQQAREEIAKRCGIAAEAVMIAASHTHSGGPIGMVVPGQFDHASELVQRLAYQHSVCDDVDYVTTVRRAIVEAVAEANGQCVVVRAGAGSGREEAACFNRRVRMANGRTYTHPGKGHPGIVEFAGPIDPEVGVLGAWSGERELLGCVVNYGCHGTTTPGGASADWIYFMEQVIRGSFGPDTVVVFLNGACGDVTQVNNLSPHWDDDGERSACYVGMRVGAEVVKVLASMATGTLAPVASRSQVLQIPRRRPSPERVQASLEAVQGGQPGSTDWVFAKEILMADALLAREPVAEVEIQALEVGPVAFVANPGELFCQFGLEIKEASPFPFTNVVELANGSVGYVPTQEAFGPTGGGYETRLTSYSNLAVTAGQEIVSASGGLLRSLTPGIVPEPPTARSWTGEWDYGNVPPELS